MIAPPVVKTSIGDGDAHFFDRVDDDVVKIISKEKIQEEYKKVRQDGLYFLYAVRYVFKNLKCEEAKTI